MLKVTPTMPTMLTLGSIWGIIWDAEDLTWVSACKTKSTPIALALSAIFKVKILKDSPQ